MEDRALQIRWESRFLYSPVSWAERAAFALVAILLMAPGLLFNSVESLLTALGMAVSFGTFVFDLALRPIGEVLFAALALANRRQRKSSKNQSKATASQSE